MEIYLMNNKNISFYFKKMPIFSSLNDIDLKRLEERSILKIFDADSTIIEQGDQSTTVYFLISGTVHVVDYSRSDRAVTYASLKDGDMFGEMAAIDGLPRSAWVFAITSCKVITLPGNTFLNLLRNNSEICLTILKQLSSKLRLADERFTDVSILGTEQRACMELIRMSKTDPYEPDKRVILQMPTQANFANIIGSSRETVSRIFTKLKEESILIKRDKGYLIANRKKLEKKAFL